MNLLNSELHTYSRSIDEEARSSLSVLASMIADGSTVLDVGTGSGALGKFLSEGKSCKVDGVSHNPEEVRIASPFYNRTVQADIDVSSLSQHFSPGSYDVIVLADVLEHLRHPEQVLLDAGRLLTASGRLLLSIPNIAYAGLVGELLTGEFRYRDEGLLDRTHLRFFTRRSLLEFLDQAGWKVTRVDEITRELRASEFQIPIANLAPSVLQRLLQLPDALTYQFIVEAIPGTPNTSGNWPAFMPTNHPVVRDHALALYWRTGTAEYCESQKLTIWGRLGESIQDLAFVLPENAVAIAGLRLDPADRPGYLHLHELKLQSPTGEILWHWDGRPESLDATEHQQISFASSDQGGCVVALMAGDDAHMELPIPNDVLHRIQPDSLITVRASWPLSTDYLALSAQLSERDAIISEGMGRESAQVEALRQLSELNQSMAARCHDLETQRERLTEQVEAMDSEQQNLFGTLADVRAELGNVAKEREQLVHHLQTIEQSTVFRLTRPLVSAKMALDRMLDGRTAAASAAVELPDSSNVVPEPPEVVDVVIPVYRGLEDTRRCLESVLAATAKVQHRIVVIEDACPEPELRVYLQSVAQASPSVLLVRNESNLGFVATVNRGMALAPDHDIVLLNSDTEVAGDWLDRLRSAAYCRGDVGTVTPLSNNATICSYPRFCQPNEIPSEFDTESLDRLCAEINGGQHVDVPTAVGFCMYIRRDCLAQVGMFDVEQFGTGYGEENDFCMRATQRGWKHLLALDTFVRHVGGVSFGAAKQKREADAFEKLRRLHPTYEGLVRDHVARDPARPARLALDIARLGASRVPTVLFVTHDRGGGTEQHVRELAHHLGGKANSLVLRPAEGGSFLLEWLAKGEEGFRLSFSLPADMDELRCVLLQSGVAHVHFHHLLGIVPEVWNLPAFLAVGYDFTIHDYYSICPQISLTRHDNRYCGELGLQQCCDCLQVSPAPGGVGVLEWRHNYHRLLKNARHVFAPSQDAASRVKRRFPDLEIKVIEHPDLLEVPLPTPTPRASGTPRPVLKVAVIGALSSIKGADSLETVAIEAARRSTPVEFHLLGYAYRRLATQPSAHLTVHGPYAEADLGDLLAWLDPDVVWFPALWPETYSYTLSACLRRGIPVVAPDIGAFPERLAGRAWTWVEPWDRDPGEWLAFFDRIRLENFAKHASPLPPTVTTVGEGQFHYRTDYVAGLQRSSAAFQFDPEVLARHAFHDKRGMAAARAGARRATLALLVRLRNSRLLSVWARRIPLRWQTRVKTWLTG